MYTMYTATTSATCQADSNDLRHEVQTGKNAWGLGVPIQGIPTATIATQYVRAGEWAPRHLGQKHFSPPLDPLYPHSWSGWHNSGGGSKYGSSTAKMAAADEEGRRMASWRLLDTTASQNWRLYYCCRIFFFYSAKDYTTVVESFF